MPTEYTWEEVQPTEFSWDELQPETLQIAPGEPPLQPMSAAEVMGLPLKALGSLATGAGNLLERTFGPKPGQYGYYEQPWLGPATPTPQLPTIPELPQVIKQLRPQSQIEAGAANALIGLAQGMVPPFAPPEIGLTAPVAGVGGVPGRVLSGLFGAPMVAEVPDQVQQAYRTITEPGATPMEMVQSVAQPAIGAVLGAGLLARAAGLTRSAEAGKQSIIGETKDAIQRETTPVLQPVQTQPVESAGEMPVTERQPEVSRRGEPAPQETPEEGPARVLPTVTETTPTVPTEELPKTPTETGVRPAIRLAGGDVVVGDAGKTHPDIIVENTLNAKDIDQRGFVDEQGKFLDREQAAAKTGLPTEREQGRQHSTDLPEAKEPAKEIIGMGGATPSEFSAEAANPDIYGIAERVRRQRAAAGQVAEVKPGKGISAPDSVEHGRDLLNKDPLAGEKFLSAFENDPNKSISADGMAAVRAHGERLAFNARRIEEKFGTDSSEYKAAWKTLSDWDTRTKPMQTEWHKAGQAQQGETDIDTGSFTGLQQAFKERTGKEFSPRQGRKAKKLAAGVTAAEETTTGTKQELFKQIIKTAREKSDADKRAIAAAHRTVRNNAIRIANAENALRKAMIEAKNNLNDVAVKRAQRELKRANDAKRKAAIEAVKAENKLRVAKADLPTYVWTKAKEYVEKGAGNFDDIANWVATDVGLPVKKVKAAMGREKRAKYLTDELYKQQQNLRDLRSTAKRWLRNEQMPYVQRAFEAIPRTMFSLKVGFHGTVALGTHAPMVAFQPRYWKTYVENFAKMYKMVGSKAYYEGQVQELLRKENYLTARRAGLVNDPFQYEDYNSPDIAQYFKKFTGMGNRGYSVLKMLRQDMFDQHWNSLPKTAKVQPIAEALADAINHSTGVVKMSAPRGTAIALFAPRLEMSRVAWLTIDPVKSANTFLNWKKSGEGEKHFAVHQLKEKAWVVGTMASLLAINQGVLSALGSKQKINGVPEELGGAGFDPFKSDFLKFKAAGSNISYGNPMITMARLPLRLWVGVKNEGKLNKIIYEDENTAKTIFDYLRTQASPFAGTIMDLAFGRDFQERPLPRAGFGLLEGKTAMPKRLRAEGVQPYTWTEYALVTGLPIPAAEAMHDVWREGMGLDAEGVDWTRKLMAIIAALPKTLVMAGTGARISEDYTVK